MVNSKFIRIAIKAFALLMFLNYSCEAFAECLAGLDGPVCYDGENPKQYDDRCSAKTRQDFKELQILCHSGYTGVVVCGDDGRALTVTCIADLLD